MKKLASGSPVNFILLHILIASNIQAVALIMD